MRVPSLACAWGGHVVGLMLIGQSVGSECMGKAMWRG